jgi:hypothetical protein
MAWTWSDLASVRWFHLVGRIASLLCDLAGVKLLAVLDIPIQTRVDGLMLAAVVSATSAL